MKRTLLLLLFFFTLNISFSQSIDLKNIEKELNVEIPTDYLNFKGEFLEQRIEIFFKIENWLFWDLKTAIEKTKELRKLNAISPNDFAFAINNDNQVLFYQNSSKGKTIVHHLDEDYDIIFYAFSLTEFTLFNKTEELINAIESDGFENQDISEIENCTGSLFQYAFYLNTSEYYDNFSEERNKRALELFLHTAKKGHPEAAHEIADYYYFKDDVDVEKVIEWREKAIELGSKEDIFELADFIIDEKLEDIDKAISLLQSLFKERWYKERALLKLSRIYMKGTGDKLNYTKGLKYANECAELGSYNAISDLAFYHYKGMGVEKDIKKAYDLLVKAEEKIIKETGSGMWGGFIEKLKSEMK